MIDTTLIILLVLTCLYYLLFLSTVWRGLKLTVRPVSTDHPIVSVIVPARNEEENIRSCLHALTQQEFDRYEIIVVDDHSVDNTRARAVQCSNESKRSEIKVIALESESGEQGKPGAIARGIEASKGEIILCTDADCLVPPKWIQSMAGCFEPSVVFVAGPVAELRGSNFLMSLQSLEFLSLLTTAAGLIGSGVPIICNGANIGYRKSAFQQVQGYGQTRSSCDDETLMQRMIAKRVGRVVFNSDPQAMVATDTPQSIHDFWTQRTRWAAKRDRYDDPLIVLRLIGLYSFFVILFLGTFASILLPALRPIVLASAILKILAEFAVLRSGARLFNSRLELFHFLIAELFHVPYIVFAAAIGQVKSMRWKGRTLDQ